MGSGRSAAGGEESAGGREEHGPDLLYRQLHGHDEYRACVELQRETWGEASREHVPASLLSVAVKVGGILAGALPSEPDAGEGSGPSLLGFVFSLAGWRHGRRAHWSHMLAVRPEARGRGIGRRLKLYQRSLLLDAGVDAAWWTFDPLVARNAHLNLNRLGALVADYVPDMYGDETGSPLHLGGATDRFVVRWDLESDRVRAVTEEDRRPELAKGVTEAPLVEPPPANAAVDLPQSEMVRVAIPSHAVAVSRDDPEAVTAWRRTTRRAFLHYLSRGYRVAGVYRSPGEERSYYWLARS